MGATAKRILGAKRRPGNFAVQAAAGAIAELGDWKLLIISVLKTDEPRRTVGVSGKRDPGADARRARRPVERWRFCPLCMRRHCKSLFSFLFLLY
ncbi:MAG: hypothetical protein LBD58_11780 [Treponema sp.]|nr:hypothetical protein [Treponema sp.]